MKTKIFAVMATGLAVLFMGAAPNSNNNNKSRNARPNAGAYVCGYYGNYGYGHMMNGVATDSSSHGTTGGWYGCGYAAMNGTASDSTHGHRMNGAYGRGYGMMGGMGYGLMKGYYGRGYGMMPMMMSMMGMMRGRMMYGANDSSFVCPFAYYCTRPQKQKAAK